MSYDPNKSGILSQAIAVVLADQTVTNSAALVNVTSLVLPVVANGKYRYRGWIPWDMGNDPTAGGSFALTYPASPNYWRTSGICHALDSSALISSQDNSIGNAVVFNLANGSHTAGCVFMFEGYLDNGANAGNIQIKFAQWVATATTLTLQKGAYIETLRVG